VIEPAPVLAVIVGLFHVSAYVFIRGRAGARLPLLLVAAVLGAWAGDTVGARMAIDPLRIGEFHLISASVVAWLAIGLVAIVAVLAPERRPRVAERRVDTILTHAHATAGLASASDSAASTLPVETNDIPAGTADPAPEATP
jgi:hypothetical protein